MEVHNIHYDRDSCIVKAEQKEFENLALDRYPNGLSWKGEIKKLIYD